MMSLSMYVLIGAAWVTFRVFFTKIAMGGEHPRMQQIARHYGENIADVIEGMIGIIVWFTIMLTWPLDVVIWGWKNRHG